MSTITICNVSLKFFKIKQISCFEPNRLWLSIYDLIKEIDENGHLLRELSVDSTPAGCHTLTKAGDLLFKKDCYIYMLSSSGEIRNLHIHADKLSCIHSSRLNGDIFVSKGAVIERYNDKGVQLQNIKTWYLGLLYLTENINGDIVTTDIVGRVNAYRNDGQYKFTYWGQHYQSEFVSTGICNDRFGHILVGNSCFNDPCVHLLDQNGELLAKLLTHQPHQGLEFNALCVDDRNNLYVGCRDRINVYTYLPDSTITEHDTNVIYSEMKPNVLRI